jgi:hypothetical protein
MTTIACLILTAVAVSEFCLRISRQNRDEAVSRRVGRSIERSRRQS